MLQAIWQTTLELAPFLLLGAALSGLLHAFLPNNLLRTHLQGRWGVVKAVAFGVPLPLCSCGVIPAGLGLRRDGASRGAAVGFMISTPQTGVDSILVSGSMLGLPFAIFKVLAALVTGLVGGFLTDALVHDAPEDADVSVAEEGGSGSALGRAYEHAMTVLQSIWRWLVFGILVSAGLNYLVPPSTWATVAGLGVGLTMVVALLISLPLYVCATASVPIAASLVAGGLPAGAALVFLMAGPATNLATLGAVYRTLGGKTLAIYLSTVVLFSMGLGYLFDSVVPVAAEMGHVHGAGSPIEILAGVTLWGLMAFFAFDELRAFLRAKRMAKVARAAAIIELPVEGMTCNGCVRNVQKALSDDPRVSQASVTLDPPQARVTGSLSAQDVVALVQGAGYRAVLPQAPAVGAPIEMELEGMTCNGCVRKLQRTLDEDPRVEQASVTLEPQRLVLKGQLSAADVAALVKQAGYTPKLVQPDASPDLVELSVEGMTCNGCVRKLQRTLDEDGRVQQASVTLEPQQVRVHGQVDRAVVEALVKKAGFRVAG